METEEQQHAGKMSSPKQRIANAVLTRPFAGDDGIRSEPGDAETTGTIRQLRRDSARRSAKNAVTVVGNQRVEPLILMGSGNTP